MEFTLFEIRNLVVPMRKLAQCDMPIKTSWKLLKLTETIEILNEKIEKFRIELVKKYGVEVYECVTSNDDLVNLTKEEVEFHKDTLKHVGQPRIEVSKDNMETFAKEFDSLLEQTEDISVEPFTLNDFSEDAKLSPQDLFFLKKIFA